MFINLIDYARYGSVIRPMAADHPARVLGYSKNLRGLLAYARKQRVVCVITKKRSAHDGDPGGTLRVIYANGAIGTAEFNSHPILIDWVRNRRSWSTADLRHLDGETGYLRSPGLIADRNKD